jgi:hypothetical protein
MPELKTFRFWCQKVLPLVYDDSLSYYETLCKVVTYINDLIAQDKVFSDDIQNLQNDLKVVQDWIANFDTRYAEKVLKEYLATMIFVDISDAGYIVYHIPSGWDSITFNTTGLDIALALQPEYGHLVLSY